MELNRIKGKKLKPQYSFVCWRRKASFFHLKFPFGCFIPASFSSYLNYNSDTHFHYIGIKISLILTYGVYLFN